MRIATPEGLLRLRTDWVGESYKNHWCFGVLTFNAKLQSVKTPGKYMRNPTRATVYFSADIFKALRMKAAATHRSMSDMVNEAVRDALA